MHVFFGFGNISIHIASQEKWTIFFLFVPLPPWLNMNTNTSTILLEIG